MRRLAVIAAIAGSAAADRPVHGSAGVGGALLATGDDGARARLELEADLEPRSRFGALVAWRGVDRDHRGTVAAGIVYEAGAARPRLVLDLHGDLGVDLDHRAPVVGAGLRTTLTVVGPLGVAFDAGTYLVLDGVDQTRLTIAASASLVARR